MEVWKEEQVRNEEKTDGALTKIGRSRVGARLAESRTTRTPRKRNPQTDTGMQRTKNGRGKRRMESMEEGLVNKEEKLEEEKQNYHVESGDGSEGLEDWRE